MATAETSLATFRDDSAKSQSKASEPVRIDITRLPTIDDDFEDVGPRTAGSSRTILHIYFSPPCNSKLVTPDLSPSQERRFGPTSEQQKERRVARKAARKLREAADPAPWLTAAPLPPNATQAEDKGDQSYYFHTPYLSFHLPPSVLYTCPSPTNNSFPPSPTPSHYPPNRPVALIHTSLFWRTYTIQLGPSLSQPGVIDPRGVVSWAHKRDGKEKSSGTALKGYKVRGWRLWGESGKRYVHWVRDMRRAGQQVDDPDADLDIAGQRGGQIRADDVVHLIWARPLSRQTRRYAFTFRGLEFQWKGTGSVSEGRKCGWMLRFCHLKLVARVPLGALAGGEKKQGVREVCLGTYTSSIAVEKSGTLEVFDEAVLGVVEEWMPSLLGEGYDGEKSDDGGKSDDGEKGDDREKGDGGGKSADHRHDKNGKIARLKQGMLYQLIMATTLCMANSEKEKRHALIDLIMGIAENGGSGGG